MTNREKPGADHINWWTESLADIVTKKAGVKLSQTERDELYKLIQDFQDLESAILVISLSSGMEWILEKIFRVRLNVL